MEKRKTSALKVSEIQQKAFDVYSYYWKEIWGVALFLVSIGFGASSFIGNASGDELNKVRSEYDTKIDVVIAREKQDCQETLNNFTKFVSSINPNLKFSSDSLKIEKNEE